MTWPRSQNEIDYSVFIVSAGAIKFSDEYEFEIAEQSFKLLVAERYTQRATLPFLYLFDCRAGKHRSQFTDFPRVQSRNGHAATSATSINNYKMQTTPSEP